MKKITKRGSSLIIIITSSALAAAAGLFLVYWGVFTKIDPVIKRAGGEVLVYQTVLGDYKQSREVSDDVYYALIDRFGLETYKGFAIYYDKPGTVDLKEQRSEIGSILEQDQIDRKVEISGFYEVRVLPEGEYLVAEFPIRGKLSNLIGMMKVYPALNYSAKRNGYSVDTPIMEIWDIPNKTIIYRKILNKETGL